VNSAKWWLAGPPAATVLAVVLLAAPAAAQDGATREAELGATQGRVEAMGEQVAALQSDVDRRKKFKFSGYVQARYEVNESSKDDVTTTSSSSVTPANTNRLYIRRGRIKLTYDSSPLSQGVVYLDAGEDRAVTLLEAYVTLRDPWTTNHRHALTVGQMNIPFGYEIERSSSVRELPERSRAENILFRGERDRGAILTSQWLPRLQTVVGLLNGPGIRHADFPNSAPRQGKDLVGRIRWTQGVFDVATSIYSGENVIPLADSSYTRDRHVTHDKSRFGADAQFYYQLPHLGGGSLKGEFYVGHEVNPDSVRTLAPGRVLRGGKDPEHLATDFSGWYVMWVQNIQERFQVAARYDVYDPNTDVDRDRYERIGGALHYFYDANVRLTAAYDAPTTERFRRSNATWYDPQDNVWTIQFQHKF